MFNKKYFGLIYINDDFIITSLSKNKLEVAAFIDDYLKDKLNSNALFNIFSFSTFDEQNYFIMLNKKTFLNGDILLLSEKEYSLIKHDIELSDLVIKKITNKQNSLKFDKNYIKQKYENHLSSELLEYIDIYFGIIEHNESTHFVGFSYDILKTIQSIDSFISNKENYKITLMHTREKYSENQQYYLIIKGNKELIFSHPSVINNFQNKGYQFYKVFCELSPFNNKINELNNYKELLRNFRYNSININNNSISSGYSQEAFMHKLGIDRLNDMLPSSHYKDIVSVLDNIYKKKDIEILISNSANDEYQIFNKNNMSFFSHYIVALIFSTNNNIDINIECSIPTPFLKNDKKEFIYSIIKFENGIYKKVSKDHLKYNKQLLISNNNHYTFVDSSRLIEILRK